MENTDLTSRQLYSAFKDASPIVEASVSTTEESSKISRMDCKHTRYCQLISVVNKEERVEWCLDMVTAGDLDLDDVIWTDECLVQLE